MVMPAADVEVAAVMTSVITAVRVLVAKGYDRANGTSTVPEAPGFGFQIDEAAFSSDVKIRYDLK